MLVHQLSAFLHQPRLHIVALLRSPLVVVAAVLQSSVRREKPEQRRARENADNRSSPNQRQSAPLLLLTETVRNRLLRVMLTARPRYLCRQILWNRTDKVGRCCRLGLSGADGLERSECLDVWGRERRRARAGTWLEVSIEAQVQTGTQANMHILGPREVV